MYQLSSLRCQVPSAVQPRARAARRCTSATSPFDRSSGRIHIVVRSASAEVVALASRLVKSEDDGDWATALEVMTEAKVLKLELPADSYESAIRIYSRSGQQWQRAADLFESLLDKGISPSEATVLALFQALAAGKQGTRAQALLQGMEAKGSSEAGQLTPLYNLTTRALAQQGDLDASVAMLEKMCMSDGRLVAQQGTFTAVITKLIEAGDDVRAEEMLEMRDYF